MKKLISIFILVTFVSVAVTAAQPSGEKSTGQAGDKTEASKGLLKTGTKNTTIREVIGQGRNRDEAIKNALYRAIEQSRGVKVDSGTYEFGYRGTSAGFNSQQPGQRSIDIDSMDFSTQGTVYTTEIGGLIKSYDVIEEKQIDPETYQVKLKVAVYDYAARGETARVKVALMPVKTMQNSYRFLNQVIPGNTLSALFSQRLAMGLTQTNKFAVLDRESISDFVGEKKMLVSFDAPLGEQAKLAETLGADYLLVGTITQAVIERIDRRLEVAEYTSSEFKARLSFNYRLVDSSTKQIVLASEAQKYLENEEVRKLADEQNPNEWNPAQVRDAFISIVINDVIEAIIDRVYPIKIAGLLPDAGQVILNQGGERMTEGMQLEVFKPGKEIIDTDTNESLGTVETHVAIIKVQKVTQTMSYATVVEGDISKISKDLVCRVIKVKKPEIPGSKSNIKRTESGGVVLPFDRN
jgi:curli biogenesis system outer membrane secretion channel CsgG